MQYRRMPKSSDELSTLGFGCMRLPTASKKNEISRKIDVPVAKKLIRDAIDSGLNYIDTAWFYHFGASETFLGEHVLTDGYREKVFLASKLPAMILTKASQMEKTFLKQLEKLHTEYIDYYLVHSLDGGTWKRMLSFGILEFMDKIKAEGKVRYMGFSFHGNIEDFRTIIGAYDWDFVMVQYNLLDEYFQAGIIGIEYAANKDIGVIVMEPLRGGTLVNKIPQRVQEIYDSAKVKRSPAEWMLRWILNNPNIQVVLSGMNEEAHVEQNMKACSEALPSSLTEDDKDILGRVKKVYDELLQVNCTGCRYCLPCPANIDIPYAFHTLNSNGMFGGGIVLKGHYGVVLAGSDKPHWTNQCIDCGQCEKACPQNIEIRREFSKVQRQIETPFIRGVIRLIAPFIRKNR